MAVFVLDASVALAWCLKDEATAACDALLERLRQGDTSVVPAHWPTELANALLFAERRKRIKNGEALFFYQKIGELPIEIEPSLTVVQVKSVLALSEAYGMTVYDAAYLELVKRRGLPLATLDTQLRKAAEAEKIQIL